MVPRNVGGIGSRERGKPRGASVQGKVDFKERRPPMPLVVRAFPVLPGKEEDIRRLAADMAGSRREEAQEFYRHFGVHRESWHYQETPNGPMVIGVTEVEDPDAKAREYAESNRPFDRWFKDQVRNLTGI